MYTKGCRWTQSQWGWHEFTNPKGYRHEETLKDYDFGRGRMEPYSVQFNEDGRQKEAANLVPCQSHRLHLGMVGFEFGRDPLAVAQVTDIKQNWTFGKVSSIVALNWMANRLRGTDRLSSESRYGGCHHSIGKRMPASISVSVSYRWPLWWCFATGLKW